VDPPAARTTAADLAAGGQALLVAAQVVLIELGRRWDLEALNPDPLRVDAAHHVTDRPVLARGVECLKHYDDAERRLRRQPALVVRQDCDPILEQSLAILLLVDACFEGGIEILRQLHVRPRGHLKRLDEAGDALGDVVGHRVLLLDGRSLGRSAPAAKTTVAAPPDSARIAGDRSRT
jgi:hypothetical protein